MKPRSLSAALLSGLTLLSLLAGPAAAWPAAGRSPAAGEVEPRAGTWKTWVLASGSELRLPPPPGATAAADELAQLEARVSQRDEAAMQRIRFWDAGAPGYRWTGLAVKHTQSRGALSNRAVRMLALLNVAISDATVAAWDTKYAYNRPRPGTARPSLSPAVPAPASPSYPDERAVAAGAASTVLAYVFPADAELFAAMAQEAAESRLLAGVAYPSDVTAGLSLGRQVGERVVAWARQDGSDAVWSGSVPTEPGLWQGVNPAEPLAGTWATWALQRPDQFRPGPRAAPGSAELQAELAAVRDYPRTNLTNLTASHWEYYGGRGAFEYWNEQASRKLFEEHLDANPPRAARTYALLNVALHDAMVACWDAKYTYWAARPAMLEPAITTLFATPNHPSYPSAHGCLSSAAGTILGTLFPGDRAYFEGLTAEVSEARIMGGIHVRSDQIAGEGIGRAVAATVLARAGGD